MGRSPEQLFPAKTIACDFVQFVDEYRRDENRWFRQECKRLGGIFSYMPSPVEDIFHLFVVCEETNRPPFKTIDLRMIYPGGDYWYIDEEEELHKTSYMDGKAHPKGLVQFSCEEEAILFKNSDKNPNWKECNKKP